MAAVSFIEGVVAGVCAIVAWAYWSAKRKGKL
jgi:hypothetical protein